jgi:hypothetical protein
MLFFKSIGYEHMDKAEIESIIQSCSRFLMRHHRRTPQQVLSELAATTDPRLEDDRYGQGEIISNFELPNYHKLEFTVGEATLDLTNDEIFDLFARLFSKCE